jgi:hypothetical protein
MNKYMGPNGFHVKFYQTFQEVIEFDLMSMFVRFQQGESPLFQLNYGTIILLLKKEHIFHIQQYKSIGLFSVSFFFTKVGTNRIQLNIY